MTCLPSAPLELTFRVHSSDALGGPHIPDADGFVSRRRDKEVRVTGMPAQLVHAITMSAVIVFFDLKEQAPGVTHVPAKRDSLTSFRCKSLTSHVTP